MKNFLIYRSSAGSGKTFTLVKEYLKLVLKDPDCFRSVLAVTFTNKSAAEMKNRIISSLISLAEGSDEKLKELLVKEGIDVNIQLAAEQVLQNILHKYSYFSVSTIDSFFHKIIRSFARELKLQLGYNIELEQQEVLDKITDKLLDDAGKDNDLTGYIEDYIYFSIDDESGWNIDHKIKSIAGEIFSERFWIKSGTENELLNSRTKLKEFIQKLFAIKNDFEGKMKQISERSNDLLNKYDLTIEDFPFKKTGYINYLLNNIVNDKPEPGSRAKEAAENINKMFSKSSKPQVKLAANEGLHDLLKSAVENYEKNIEKFNSARELIKTIYVTGIFKDLLDKLKAYRDDNKILLISDVNNLLISVISGESSPFIYEKTGSYYKNFLIDEFQDTSTFQWRNFKPLIENALSENNASIIVGDIKQSIYRWRNGNMKLLLEEVKNDLQLFRSEIDERTLGENYRSRKEIIEFNNSFFSKAAAVCSEWAPEGTGEVIKRAYSESSQTPGKEINGGYVSIKFYNKVSGNDKDESEEGALTSGTDDDPKERSITSVIYEIKNLLSSGYRQRDILLLVRNNTDAMLAAQALINGRLRVVSSDSLLLTNSPKVRLLINLFKYITDKSNSLAYTEVLYDLLVYIRNEKTDLNMIFTEHLKGKSSIFYDTLPPEFFESKAHSVSSRLLRLPLYELAEELIRIFSLNENADSYLLRFLDLIKEYTDKNNSGLYGFIKWWEDNKSKTSIIIPEDEDAVRIMTIHKAKGLQAPVVFLPFANWPMELKSGRDMFWASAHKAPFNSSPSFFLKANKSLERSYFTGDYCEEKMLTLLDNLNMLYVAFTRAEERLYVNIPQSSFSSKRSGDLIKEVLLNNLQFSEYYDVTAGSYVTGDKTISPAERKENTGSAYRIKNINSGNFLKDVLLKPGAEYFHSEKLNDTEKFRDRGIILHRGLSYINTASEKETGYAAQKLAVEGLITFDKVSETEKELKNILSIEEVKQWYKPGLQIMNERDIVLPGGKIYRPDRVILNKDKAVIIDYKAGKRKSEHIKQVTEYAEVIKQMGFKETENFIFYLAERKIEKV